MNPRQYHRELEELIASLGGKKPRLALHSCCGPCSSYCLETLAPHFAVTVFFCNPNILPPEEFERRLYWQRYLLEHAPFAEGVELVVPPYDPDEFLSAARGMESLPEGGARCTECFRLRLGKTAEFARENGFDYFGTTLTVSPHKNAPLINALGEELAAGSGVSWLPSDFKKKEGYKRSCELAREYGLYRQDWCGCGLGATP